MYSQRVKTVKTLVKKFKIKSILPARTYFPKLRIEVKASRYSFIVLYFWGSFFNFLISLIPKHSEIYLRNEYNVAALNLFCTVVFNGFIHILKPSIKFYNE